MLYVTGVVFDVDSDFGDGI